MHVHPVAKFTPVLDAGQDTAARNVCKQKTKYILKNYIILIKIIP